MAQVPYRANLSASTWPLISNNQGRTVIVPGQDQNYVRGLAANDQGLVDANDKGIPQIYYCHNVLPSAQGFQSVGYLPTAAAGFGAVLNPAGGISNIINVFDNAGNLCYIAFDSTGKCGALLQTYVEQFAWTAVTITNPLTVDPTPSDVVTYATVNGVTYIYIAGDANPCRKYNFATNTLDTVTLTGFAASLPNAKGIASSYGYLVGYNKDIIGWSSTIDPTDFVPSTITGAGNGKIEQAKGSINFLSNYHLGFIIFCTDNAVSGLYSGNIRFPFNFRELVSSGGCIKSDFVTSDANTNDLYGYTNSGLQLINANATQVVYPDITDFIEGQVYEDFNETTLVFTRTPNIVFNKKFSLIGGRFLVMSYGPPASGSGDALNPYQYALVIDLSNKRWGKLKMPHYEVFECLKTSQNVGAVRGRGLITFVKKTGTLFAVLVQPNNSTSTSGSFPVTVQPSVGVILLGKYQFIRQRVMQLQQVDVESSNTSNAGTSFTCYAVPSLDGKTLGTPVAGTPNANSGNELKSFNWNLSAINHSLLFIGAFYLSTIVMKFNINGRR